MNSSESFVQPLQQRDSILIGDQIRYGVDLKGTPEGTGIGLPVVGDTLSKEVIVVEKWKLDTLKTHRKDKTNDIRASLVLTTFDEGEYHLPDVPVALRNAEGHIDTLIFKGQQVTYCTIPVDTATFKIHDIKGQKTYPLTFVETLPWIGGFLFLAALVAGIIYIVKRRRKAAEEALHKDPPHIIALRKLDEWRGDKFWAPAKQKLFYSGVTDALREYISARYGVGAMEMTTVEIFNELKHSDMPEDLKSELRELFELSDRVKFAKWIASDEDNAGVLPLSVRFVTSTYQEEIEGENNVL